MVRPSRPLSVPKQSQAASTRPSFSLSLSYGVNLYDTKRTVEAVRWLTTATTESSGTELAYTYASSLLTKIYLEMGDSGELSAYGQGVEWAEKSLSNAKSVEIRLISTVNLGVLLGKVGEKGREEGLQRDLTEICSILLGVKRQGEGRAREKVKNLAGSVLDALRPNETVFARVGFVYLPDYYPEVRLWVQTPLLPPCNESIKVTQAVATANEKMETHKAMILGAIGAFDPLDF